MESEGKKGMINKHEKNDSQRRVEHVVSLPDKEIHPDIQTAHYRAQSLLIAGQVRSIGINRVGKKKDTNLTKHLPGFSLVKEPHDDPRILALHHNIKNTQHNIT